MDILVTGATGCLGRNLVISLANLGHNVIATGRNIEIGKSLISHNIKFCKADLSKTDNLDAIFQNQEIVFHSAALSSPWGTYEQFYLANILSTQNVVEQCLKHKVRRLVHVSTPSIYFDFQDRFNIREDEPLPQTSVNLYAKTKLIAEGIVDKAFKDGLEVVTIRPRAIFGPYDQTLMPRIIRASTKGRFPLIDGGNNILDVTFVGNVVEALILCMEAKEEALGAKFNITNDSPIMLKELLSKIFAKLDIEYNPRIVSYNKAMQIAGILEFIAKLPLISHEPKLTKYGASVLAKSQTLDISKAKMLLGYKPKYTIDQGIDIFAKWWKMQHEN